MDVVGLNIAGHYRSGEMANIVQVCELQIDVRHYRSPQILTLTRILTSTLTLIVILTLP